MPLSTPQVVATVVGGLAVAVTGTAILGANTADPEDVPAAPATSSSVPPSTAPTTLDLSGLLAPSTSAKATPATPTPSAAPSTSARRPAATAPARRPATPSPTPRCTP